MMTEARVGTREWSSMGSGCHRSVRRPAHSVSVQATELASWEEQWEHRQAVLLLSVWLSEVADPEEGLPALTCSMSLL